MAGELINVTMPDGTVITDVPSDITQEDLLQQYSKHKATSKPSVLEAMKEGAARAFSPESIKEFGQQIGPGASERMARTGKFLTGMADLPANIMKITGISEKPAEVVQAAKSGLDTLQQAGGGTGVSPAVAGFAGELASAGKGLQLAGKALSPLTKYMPEFLTTPLSKTVAGSAGVGAAASPTGETQDILQSAGEGALWGAGAHGLMKTIGAVASPALERAKQLAADLKIAPEQLRGTTMGQFFGGPLQTIENLASGLPFTGIRKEVVKGQKLLDDLAEANKESVSGQAKVAKEGMEYAASDIQAAEKRAADKLLLEKERVLEQQIAAQKLKLKDEESAVHIPALNKALEPLGVQIPPGMTGQAAMKFAQDARSAAYDTALKNIKGLRITGATEKDLLSVLDDYSTASLTPELYNALENKISNIIANTKRGGWLTSEKWQGLMSELGSDAHAAINRGGVFEPKYGRALLELQDKLMSIAEKKAGTPQFVAANKTFAAMQPLERASTYLNSLTAGGEFTPSNILNALKAGMSSKRLAAGESEMQKMAQEAHDTILKRRADVEAEAKKLRQSHADEKTATQEALDKKHTQQTRNVKDQTDYLKTLANKKIESYQKAMEGMRGDTQVPYEIKRAGMIGSGLGGGYAAANLLGASLPHLAGIYGAGAGLSNILYSGPMQRAIQRAALMNRPAAVRQVGEQLKAAAPAVGVATAQERMNKAAGGLASLDD